MRLSMVRFHFNPQSRDVPCVQLYSLIPSQNPQLSPSRTGSLISHPLDIRLTYFHQGYVDMYFSFCHAIFTDHEPVKTLMNKPGQAGPPVSVQIPIHNLVLLMMCGTCRFLSQLSLMDLVSLFPFPVFQPIDGPCSVALPIL
jgi:hypothetical protein